MIKEIPINRKRIPRALVVTFILAIAFGYATFFPSPSFSDATLNRVFCGVGSAVLLFYAGVMLADFIKRRFDKNVVFRITDNGVYDNTGIYSIGEIRWSDITALEITKILEVDVLLIKVIDPYRYLAAMNPLMRYQKKKLLKKWHAPIMISQVKLNYDLDQLHEELSQLLHKYRAGHAAGAW